MTAGAAPLPDGGWLSFDLQGPETAHAPLVLLRPLGGSRLLWSSFVQALTAKMRVLTFDPRGVGDSSALDGITSTRCMAGDVRALLNHLSIDKAHVAGLSLGGMVATWLALDAPERVERLVLASTLPRPKRAAWDAIDRLLPMLPAFVLPAPQGELRIVRRLLSLRFRRENPEETRRIDELIRRHPVPRQTLLAFALAALRHDAEAELPRIQAPTLLIFGSDDPWVKRRARRELESRIDDSQVEIIEGCGHDLSIEQPQRFAERVLAFLVELPSNRVVAPLTQ